MSKICVFCSSAIDDDAVICPVCGKDVVNVKAEENEENVTLKENGGEEKEEAVTEEPVAEEAVAEESVAEESVAEDPVTEMPVAQVSEQEHTCTEKPLADKENKKPLRTLTAGGVISAVFLAIMIILNVALIFGCALGYGAAKSDIYNYRFDLGDGNTFSLSDIKNSDPAVAHSTSDIVKGIFDVLEVFSYDAGDQTFSLDFSDSSKSLVEAAMENSHQFEQIIQDGVNTLSDVCSLFMLCLGCYVLLVTIIFTVTLIFALARKRSALIIPGVILMVMGIAGMAFVLLASFTSGIINIAAITQLFSIDSVIMSTLITTAFSSVAGTILTVIGTAGKKN